ncbi:MAG: c-type cytochrome [Burkholderiaceae bacterium]
MKPLLIALLASFAVSAQAGDKVRGAQLAKDKACASCHGADYNTPIDPSYPKLAGQYEDYLYKALLQYKRGAAGDKSQALSRNNAIMTGQASTLTNRDKADLAAYLASLPTQLSHKK